MLAAITNAIRAQLGLDRMEHVMASVADALTRLAEQQKAASAAQLVSFQNLQSAVDQLRRSTELSEEDQKAVDRLSQGFDDMIRDAQAADDGVEQPVERPVDEQPTGEVPPADGVPVTDPDAASAEGDAGR
jgi:multidrug efflux pump subunit AcrA (membrane-fusion protein)